MMLQPTQNTHFKKRVATNTTPVPAAAAANIPVNHANPAVVVQANPAIKFVKDNKAGILFCAALTLASAAYYYHIKSGNTGQFFLVDCYVILISLIYVAYKKLS